MGYPKFNSRGFEKRICGAQLRRKPGRHCRRYCAPNKTRCRLHGGLSTGPKFPDAKERSLAAANAGLARWRDRMRRAKAAGLIAKFPCGRKPGPSRRQREEQEVRATQDLERRRL